ncbi:probable G-protein coupled receptor 149 [Neopelma chrysocephalum]|uniref:probable G-protein coupled receptor 149 n=1 Tax=Neopelma chrysocephalum TaxID=114329 RepID=UPI000FCCFD95|nr:probable G-protein coupled receptor 149 [Neopelma chrysocephalum]
MPRTMSVMPGNLSLNGTSFFSENRGIEDKPSEQRTWNVFLFCLTLTIAFPALLSSIYSLVSLLKMQNKTTVSMIVTSLAVDDLISIVPLIIFMLMQWSSEGLPQPLCTTSALLYLFQGISSNLKGSLLVSYNFYTISTAETPSCRASKRRVSVGWAILLTWIVGLLICILPLCGWGRYIPTSWGCFTDCASPHVLFVLVVYSLCVSLLAVLAVPLTPQLLCSAGPQLSHPDYLQVPAGFTSPGTPAAAPALSPLDPVDKTLELCHNSGAVLGQGVAGSGALTSSTQSRSFAQKRFSLILALTKVVLWLPMMVQMVVQHITGVQSLVFEALSFLLSALAATATPLFVLSEHWLHLPCGCIISCSREPWAGPAEQLKTKHRGFEFNLSFQQGYGIYRISQENHPQHSSDGKSTSCHSLVGSDCEDPEPGRGGGGGPGPSPPHPPSAGACRAEQSTHCDPPATPEGPEWRLSHEESHKPELTDWEWCRSKSERTPRQRPGGALAIPLCAFQGTVSLQAPTGKTLSLSTYEVSSEGHKITPTAKKIEVYRSKSVGHEPSPEGSPHTNVKIHLEVLEICDNEEALDTVSIISNISQSSTQARSPSLRYSRRENRFVSCELGESASYSLLIPSHSPGGDISISIPDTVEGHRSSSRQHVGTGHQEEIQLLNKAYREREERGSS